MNLLVPLNPAPVRKDPKGRQRTTPATAAPLPPLLSEVELEQLQQRRGKRAPSPAPQSSASTTKLEMRFQPSRLVEGFHNEAPTWRTLRRTKVNTDFSGNIVSVYDERPRKPGRAAGTPTPSPSVDQHDDHSSPPPPPRATSTVDYQGKRILFDPFHQPVPDHPLPHKAVFTKPHPWVNEWF